MGPLSREVTTGLAVSAPNRHRVRRVKGARASAERPGLRQDPLDVTSLTGGAGRSHVADGDSGPGGIK